MSWSTTYDRDYRDGLRAARESAQAAGDTETVKDLQAQERHAREHAGEPIN